MKNGDVIEWFEISDIWPRQNNVMAPGLLPGDIPCQKKTRQSETGPAAPIYGRANLKKLHASAKSHERLTQKPPPPVRSLRLGKGFNFPFRCDEMERHTKSLGHQTIRKTFHKSAWRVITVVQADTANAKLLQTRDHIIVAGRILRTGNAHSKKIFRQRNRRARLVIPSTTFFWREKKREVGAKQQR